MGKNKKVFVEAVSEMKHFLLGSALVLTLVTVVPALAQEQGGMPPPPPPPQQGQQMPPPPQNGGQQLPPPQNGGQQLPPPQNGGQQLPPPQNGQMPPLPNGQVAPQQGQQGGMIPCISLGGKMVAPVECDAADKAAGKLPPVNGQLPPPNGQVNQPVQPNQFPGKVNEGVFPGRANEGMFPGKGPEGKMPDGGKMMPAATVQMPTFSTTKGLNLAPLDFTDIETGGTGDTASFVQSIDEQAVAPIVTLLDSGKVKTKKGVTQVASKAAKVIFATQDQVCGSFDNRGDVRECKTLYKNLKRSLTKAKTADDLTGVLEDFVGSLQDLAGVSTDTTGQ